MTPIVVDASVAAKWFIKEENHDDALALLDQPSLLHAPDLLLTEFANIAWKKCVRGEISEGQAVSLTEAIPLYLPNLHGQTSLLGPAMTLAIGSRHSVYDCIYLALAVELGGIMVTADRRLKAKLEGTPLAWRILFVDQARNALDMARLHPPPQ